MKITISGASGFLGSHLVPHLRNQGHTLQKLVRSKDLQKDLFWDYEKEIIDHDSLEGQDVIIHLAGENIAKTRWTRARKEQIRYSRVQSTRFLSQTIQRLNNPPSLLITASASGFYGNRGDEWLDENSCAGQGFLPEVCKEWENASGEIKKSGVRILHLRFGIILDQSGGALQKMITPFRWGIGGQLGRGDQYMSWITLMDTLNAISHCIQNNALYGPVNIVSPGPITNREWTHQLAQKLNRPALFSVPSFALQILLGEMAQELLLASARIKPAKLLDSDFTFQHPDLSTAFNALLS